MDKSKLPKLSKKSSESPWEPTDSSRAHERRRLSDRAGTSGRTRGAKVFPFPVSLALPVEFPGKEKKSWKGDKVSKSEYREGKYPGTDKPGKKGRRWRWESPEKGKKDQSEY